MLRAALLAIGDLFAPRVTAILCTCAFASLGVFFAGWWLLARGLQTWTAQLADWAPWLSDFGAGLVTFGLAWLLLPAVLAAIVGLYLEPIAAAVEARHYPGLPKAPGQPFASAVVATVRLLGLGLLANVLLLVLLVVVPVVYPFAWLVVNGWLLGREYFDLVGLRRLPRAQANALRGRAGGEVWLIGATIALGSAVPVVNLIAPVWATALFVHRHAAWRQASGG